MATAYQLEDGERRIGRPAGLMLETLSQKKKKIKHRKATGCLEENVLSCHSWVLIKVL